MRSAIEALREKSTTTKPVGHDVGDLRFIADILRAADRRLVVEDFHYLSVQERKTFAFDLKALWDYGVFVVIVGVWSEQNLLLFLNADLSGRVRELPIVWRPPDLREIFSRGGSALKLKFDDRVQEAAIADCFENAGVLQRLIQGMLDELGIEEEQDETVEVDSLDALEAAAMAYLGRQSGRGPTSSSTPPMVTDWCPRARFCNGFGAEAAPFAHDLILQIVGCGHVDE